MSYHYVLLIFSPLPPPPSIKVLTYEWSLPMMRDFYPGIIFPGDQLYLQSGLLEDGSRMFTFKDLIDANIEQYVTYTIHNEQFEWKKKKKQMNNQKKKKMSPDFNCVICYINTFHLLRLSYLIPLLLHLMKKKKKNQYIQY